MVVNTMCQDLSIFCMIVKAGVTVLEDYLGIYIKI